MKQAGATVGAITPEPSLRTIRDVKIELTRADQSRRRFELDAVADALASGRVGGIAHNGPVAAALRELLDRFEWPVDLRDFVGAMPHYAPDLTLADMRAAMHRLGYESRRARLRGHDLRAASPTTLIVLGDNSLALRSREGNPGFINPATGAACDLRPGDFFDCIIFQHCDHSAPTGLRESWSRATLSRFSPEIRNLLVLIFLSNTVVILASLFIILIFNKVIPAKAHDTLTALLIGLGALIALDLFLRRLRSRLVGRMSGRTEYLLGSALFSKLMSLKIGMIANASVSEQIGRLKQFETVRDIFNGPVVAVLLELPFALMLLATLSILSPAIGLLLMAIIGVFAVASVLIFPRLRNASARYSAARAQHSKLLLEALAQRPQIARTGIGPIWTERLTASVKLSVEERLKLDAYTRCLRALATLLTPVCAGAVLMLGALLAMDGRLQTGVLIATTILLWRLLAPVQQALMAAARVPEITALFRQIDAMMALPETEPARNVHVWQQIPASPASEAVFFRYPRSLAPALSAISFRIEEGEFVAITGPSGSGKSTLLRLLGGLLNPVSGTVSLGGINLNQLPAAMLARKIGYVSQSPMLFHGTLLQNLTIAAPEASADDISSLIGELGLGTDIAGLPQGLETRLDHALQSHLTPGFVTMICLGRTLLAKPSVLLLDEPASGLSPEYEAAMMAALMQRKSRMTCLMVTHRPSHMRLADRVLHLNAGQMTGFAAPNPNPGRSR